MNNRIIKIIEKFKIKCERGEDWIELKDPYGFTIINNFDDELEVCLVHERCNKPNRITSEWTTYDSVISYILLEVVNKGLKDL